MCCSVAPTSTMQARTHSSGVGALQICDANSIFSHRPRAPPHDARVSATHVTCAVSKAGRRGVLRVTLPMMPLRALRAHPNTAATAFVHSHTSSRTDPLVFERLIARLVSLVQRTRYLSNAIICLLSVQKYSACPHQWAKCCAENCALPKTNGNTADTHNLDA